MSDPSHALRLSLNLNPKSREAFAEWQSKATDVFGKFDGFLNSEFLRDSKANLICWRITARFSTADRRQAWLDSAQWKALRDQLEPLLLEDLHLELFEDAASDGSPTEIIVTKVKPEKMEAYRSWEIRIRNAQNNFPGFLGSFIHPPQPGEDTWTTLIQFDSQKNLQRWLKSPERRALLEEVGEMVEYNHAHSIPGSFPGWVPNDPLTGNPPPNWKTALLVLTGLYPIVATSILIVNPLLAGLTSAVVAFVGCIIGVTLTTWLTMPLLIRWFGWWLFPKANTRVDAKGIAILLVVFAIEILVFEAGFHFR